MVDYAENRGSIGEKSEKTLAVMENSIDSKIRRVNPDGCFIRLSTRSPKDAIHGNSHSRELVMGEIFEFVYDEYKTCNIMTDVGEILKTDAMNSRRSVDLGYFTQQNELLKFIRKGITKALKVTTGKECMQLLLKSERTLRDLRLALEFPKIWNMQLIVREFDDNVELRNEFRGFVYNNQLNALSQYDKEVYYQDLFENKDDISAKIGLYWEEKIQDLLKDFKNYIIDFVIIENSVKVIELNPFDIHTGGCCFTWERDVETFKSGPFEFRTVKDVPRLKHLLWPWESMLLETRRRTLKQKTKDKIVLVFVLFVLVAIVIVCYALFEHLADMVTRKAK
jgi:hypothetical protein